MGSPFFGLDIAARSLAAQQQALDTVAHNTANANTPGYSRQEAELITTPPYTLPTMNYIHPSGQLGTGVEVAATRRLRDAFLDAQVRKQTLSLGNAEVKKDTLRQVESIYNEPSDSGLQQLMSKFWAAWQELTSDPANSTQRASLREQARTLTNALNQAYTRLKDIQTDLNSQIKLRVAEVNSLTSRIGALNTQITGIETMGNHANDLRDQRDLLLDKLYHILPVSTVEGGDGQVHIFFNGQQIVAADRVVSLDARANAANGGSLDLTLDGGTTFLTATSGQLGGLQAVRDNEVAGQIAKLDTLAVGLRDAVNPQHRAGYGLDGVDNRDFFAGSGAANLAVSADVETSLDRIAAAANGEGAAGAGNALSIAGLQTTPITLGSESLTTGDYYRSTVAQLGVASQAATNAADNQDAVLKSVERQRQEVSGVSLDEEAVHMLQYQRAYQAAARMVTVMDEMLDHLINRTGLAGRA